MDKFFKLQADRLPHITYLGLNIIPDYWRHFKRATHEYILYFVTSGNMYLQEGDKKYHLQAGDMIMLEPFLEHKGYKDSSCHYFYAHFSCLPVLETVIWDGISQEDYVHKYLQLNYTESFLSEALYNDLPLLIPKQMHIEKIAGFYHISDLLTSAITKNHTKEINYKFSISSCLMEVFKIISNLWMESINTPSRMHVSADTYEKSTQLLNYLHTSYQEKITGGKIEGLFSMNFDYLNRIFKKRTGSTIFAYLNQIRLDQAKQLLITTPLSLSEIASMTGFSDVYYFSHFFKKQVGIPPALYRRQRK